MNGLLRKRRTKAKKDSFSCENQIIIIPLQAQKDTLLMFLFMKHNNS